MSSTLAAEHLATERPDTVSALERGIAVLRCFTEERRLISQTELAKLTGIPRPTAIRLAGTLVALGLLRLERDGERYALAAGVLAPARAFLAGLDVRAVARPHMQALAEQFGGSVYLAVRDGLEMVLIEACRARSSMLAPRLDVGSRVPMASSSLGRAYLGAVAPAESAALVESLRLARGKDGSAVLPGLARALDDMKRLGYCVSVGEFHREINSAAVPLIAADGEVMALNCGGSAHVFSEGKLRRELAPALQSMAQAIAHEIGGSLPEQHRG